MPVFAWLVLSMMSIVSGGQHVVHYILAHEEAHHTDGAPCASPDHSLPHFHAAQYCAWCHMDSSVLLFADTVDAPDVAFELVYQSPVFTVSVPFIPATETTALRGPPAYC